MLSRSFFPNFGQGPFLKIAGKSPIVEEPVFKNVKNKHLGMPPFKQNFHFFYP